MLKRAEKKKKTWTFINKVATRVHKYHDILKISNILMYIYFYEVFKMVSLQLIINTFKLNIY